MTIRKFQDFLDDLWFDIRERRLVVPIAALAAVILAMPVILGGAEESPPPARAPAPDVIETQPAVALADESGVRSGKSRLSGQDPKNPFTQQLQSTPDSAKIDDATAGAAAADASLQQQASSAAEQLASQLQQTTGGGGGNPTSSSGSVESIGSTTGSEPKTKIKKIKETIVKLEQRSLRVRFGEQGKRNKITGLESLDQLPRHDDPVLILLGVDRKSGKAMFDVASRVKSVWGKGKCTPARNDCDYLTLKPGQSAKLRYQPRAESEGATEPDPVVYSLTVVRVSTKRIDAK